jgi:uncharacterized protein (TIGR03000 family)
VPASDYGYNLYDPHPGYYGGGYYREYYAVGRGWGVANFPLPLPNYPPYYPENYPSLFHRYHVEPAPLVVPGPVIDPLLPVDEAVHFVVQVPEGAAIWIDGATTGQTGTTRQFVSPPLTPGRTYSYELRVRWTDAGKAVEQTQSVAVRAGDRLNVVFPLAEPLPAPKQATADDAR